MPSYRWIQETLDAVLRPYVARRPGQAPLIDRALEQLATDPFESEGLRVDGSGFWPGLAYAYPVDDHTDLIFGISVGASLLTLWEIRYWPDSLAP